jgi:hypothetical protein
MKRSFLNRMVGSMTLDTFVGIVTIGCILCAVTCEITQRVLIWYERRYRLMWISWFVDAAIFSGAIHQMEEAHRYMDMADAQIRLAEERWQKELDARQE